VWCAQKSVLSHSPTLPPPVTAKHWVVIIPGDESEQEIDGYGGKDFKKRRVLRREWKTPWELLCCDGLCSCIWWFGCYEWFINSSASYTVTPCNDRHRKMLSGPLWTSEVEGLWTEGRWLHRASIVRVPMAFCVIFVLLRGDHSIF